MPELRAGSADKPDVDVSSAAPAGGIPPRPGRSRHVPRRRIVAIAALLVAVGVVWAAGLWVTEPPRSDPAWQSAQAIDSPSETAGQLAAADATRPNYRFSVVPGGVHSVLEMRQAIKRDPVVATHYAGLDPGKFRVEALPARVEAHVSYRKGDEVFWTRKKLVLKAGETVLTDGTNIICARCGNRVSMDALQPELPEEPAAGEFEQLAEPVVVAALSPPDALDPGAILDPRLSSSAAGDSGWQQAYGTPLMAGGSSAGGSGSPTSGSESGAGSASATGSNQGPNPGSSPGIIPGFGGGRNSPSAATPNTGPGTSSPGPNSGPGPGSNPGSGPGPNPNPGPGSSPLALPTPGTPWPAPGPGPSPNGGPWSEPGSPPNPAGPWPGSGPVPNSPGPWPGSGPTAEQPPVPTPEPTPEPTTLVLTGLGAAGLYFAHVRRRSRHSRP